MIVLVHLTSMQNSVSQALTVCFVVITSFDIQVCMCSGGSDHVQQQLHSYEAANIQCVQ